MSVDWCGSCQKYTNNCGCQSDHNQGTGEFVDGFYLIRGENLNAGQGASDDSSSNGAEGDSNGTSNGDSNGESNGQSNGSSGESSSRQ